MTFQLRLDRSMSGSDKIAAMRGAGFSVPEDISIAEDVEIIGSTVEFGHRVVIEKGVKLVFDHAAISDGVRIGRDSDIRASELILESGVAFSQDVRALVAERLRIGRNAFIGHSGEIVCKEADIGEGLFCEHDVSIGGGGGATGPYSQIQIGRFVHIGEFSVLNTARKVVIGDEAGLGAHVMVYTHGMWPPVLEGYPVTYGPVTIGAKAWITGRCIVLPNVSVGDGAVVAMGSVVTRNLPSHCMAGGVPAKVIREGVFDRQLSQQEKDVILRDILLRYVPELEFKGLAVVHHASPNGVMLQVDDAIIWYATESNQAAWPTEIDEAGVRRIVLTWESAPTVTEIDDSITLFDLNNMSLTGDSDSLSEDLRDFLRRNCVRFYTQNKFRSITPPSFARLALE